MLSFDLAPTLGLVLGMDSELVIDSKFGACDCPREMLSALVLDFGSDSATKNDVIVVRTHRQVAGVDVRCAEDGPFDSRRGLIDVVGRNVRNLGNRVPGRLRVGGDPLPSVLYGVSRVGAGRAIVVTG